MKQYILFIVVCCCTNLLSAQTGAIKVGLSGFNNGQTESFGLGGGLTLEYRMGRKFTFAGVVDYTSGDAKASGSSSSSNTSFSSSFTSTAITFRPETRFYFKESMKGFFLGLGLGLCSYKYGKIQSSISGIKLDVSSRFLVNPALMLGLNLQPSPKFCIELSGGFGITGDDETSYGMPLAVRVGYSF